MKETKIGTIKHYFDNLGVAILQVEKPIKLGDKIRIEASDKLTPFVQIIENMQVNHQDITKANPGQEIGLKVDKPCKDNDEVILLS